MARYSVGWKKKTVAGKSSREFAKVGTKGRKSGRNTARTFAKRKKREGFKGVYIYDAVRGRRVAVD
jgi:hypothetical protein